jgi:hypothetical protein
MRSAAGLMMTRFNRDAYTVPRQYRWSSDQNHTQVMLIAIYVAISATIT